MRGRRQFTRTEVAQIREILHQVRRAERDRQKSLRGRLRRLGFYISDFSTDASGFTRSDFDELVSTGQVVVVDDDA